MGTFVPDNHPSLVASHDKLILPNGINEGKLLKEDIFISEIITDSPSNVSSYDVEWDSDGQPTGERWPPLGAPNDDNVSLYSFSELGRRSCASGADLDRLKELEYEQEELNGSLFALSTHFAQVQFRLKQIVEATPTEKEDLLKELEAFANRGIPDARKNASATEFEEEEHESRLDCGHERQKELIVQLKQQLEDLENYAYQTGEADLPQATVLKKQKVILDQLKDKLNLNVDLDHLSMDDLRQQADSAVKELINPLRMKEQLVNQLQTQVVDLERYIEFLQGGDNLPAGAAGCRCDGHVQPELPRSMFNSSGGRRPRLSRGDSRQQLRRDTENLINKTSTILSMLTFGQMGCGSQRFERNSLKKTTTGYHWGDLRATLEVAVANVQEAVRSDLIGTTTDCRSSEEVTSVVRKQLAPALRDLIQHGLMPVSNSLSVVPFLSCFPQRSSATGKMMHAWELILKYYNLKKGDQYNRTPARKLSQSFQLDITGGNATTNKQLILQIIGNILSTHAPLKRSQDSQFKAFLCSALNENKLVVWLRLIFRTPSVIEESYQSWSYTVKTGFEDSLKCLDQLGKLPFNLPINLAVKSFESIKDVF